MCPQGDLPRPEQGWKREGGGAETCKPEPVSSLYHSPGQALPAQSSRVGSATGTHTYGLVMKIGKEKMSP